MPDLMPKGWKSHHVMQGQRGPIEMHGAHDHVGFSALHQVYKEFLVGKLADTFKVLEKTEPKKLFPQKYVCPLFWLVTCISIRILWSTFRSKPVTREQLAIAESVT